MTADLISAKLTPDLAFISQHLFTAILWINDELSITWLNAQAEQLLAISSGRLLNQSILTLLAPEELTSTDNRNHSDNNNVDVDKSIGKGINDFYEFALCLYDIPVLQIVFYHFGIATNLAVQLIGFL